MVKKITVNTLRKYKESNEKFSVLTAYDYSTAKYIDEAGIDVVLIGDSLAMVALGYETTNAIGVEEMSIGAFCVRFQNVVRNNFNTSLFKKKYLELYNAFIKQSTYRKFSIS